MPTDGTQRPLADEVLARIYDSDFEQMLGLLKAGGVQLDLAHLEHLREAGKKAGLGRDIGWHTFRHSYRSWMDNVKNLRGIEATAE